MAPITYADWKAPKADTAVLLWPEGGTGAGGVDAETERNRAGLAASSVRIAGVPLSEVREQVRGYLGHNSDAPLIVTGHQTELHHPGVWVKNAVIHHLAVRMGGRAMHLAVDTDQPKHLTFKYPTHRDGATPPVAEALTDDPDFGRAEWSGRVASASPAYALGLERRFAADSGAFGFEPAAKRVLASLRAASVDEASEGVLPPALVSALHELDWSLGLRYDAILASPLWMSPGFLLLANHLIANAVEYAGAYNAALGDYRAEEGIDNPGRPMPDLRVSERAVELPLWLDDLATGGRTRGAAVLVDGRWSLRVGEAVFTPTAAGGWEEAEGMLAFLRKHNHRLAPRALTLTTFARLAFADLFVHGIGGGRYDQVTDRTIATFFGVEPPRFAVATGTLYFPWAEGRARACVPCVRQEGHRLKHALLGAGKREYLRAIEAAPRRSPARKQAFLDMQAELRAKWPGAPELAAWQGRLDATVRAAGQDALIFDRELFYALQPAGRLADWIERVGRELGA